MIIDEFHDGQRWCFLLRCDYQVSNKCRLVWKKQRTTKLRENKHKCQACNNKLQASKAGRIGGVISGALAVQTGQIEKFIAAGKASSLTEAGRCALRESGKKMGKLAVESGQLAEARKLAHTPEAQRRSWETKRQHGQHKSSYVEDDAFTRLALHFDVERHVYIDGYHIDMYIPSKDVYIQFDGEYFHGLDRPYEDLNESQRAKYDRDRRADEHFKSISKKLVRITDKQFKSMSPIDFECWIDESLLD